MNRTFSFDVGGQSAKSMAVAAYGATASPDGDAELVGSSRAGRGWPP